MDLGSCFVVNSVRKRLDFQLELNDSEITKHGFYCKTPAKRTDIVWQTFRTLLVKHACALGHRDKHRLTSTFRLSMFLKIFENIVCFSQAKMFVKHMFAWWANRQNIVLDKQNFKCLPNNVCPFGRGLRT